MGFHSGRRGVRGEVDNRPVSVAVPMVRVGMEVPGVRNRMIRMVKMRMRHPKGRHNEIGAPQNHDGDHPKTHGSECIGSDLEVGSGIQRREGTSPAAIRQGQTSQPGRRSKTQQSK
jgi:hypothetical protein